MEACTCHISNLRCKNEKCLLLITSRALFKSEIGNILGSIFENLHKKGFTKKSCIRALRRELNHRNNLQNDIFDVMANAIWSRGLGHSIATHFIKQAGGKDGVHAEPAVLDENTDLGAQ